MPKKSVDIVCAFGSVRVNGRAKASFQGETGVRQWQPKAA